jgi:IS605 OrfB family transposase
MYLIVKQQIKQLSKEEYQNIKELSRIAKSLYNQGLYNVRQYYFTEGEYLNYEKNNVLLKNSPNYKKLNANMAQQILKEVDGAFKSFFGLIDLAKKGKYNFSDIQIPRYKKKGDFITLVIGFVRLGGAVQGKQNAELRAKLGLKTPKTKLGEDYLVLPYSNLFNKSHRKVVFKIPPILVGKRIKEIRIIPKAKARFFEIQYVYQAQPEQRKLNPKKALAIDVGVNNLATCVTNTGESFIVDGRRLKSINQWFNKRNSRLQSIKDKQKFGKRNTNQQKALSRNRNNRMNDYLSKAARLVINYCLEHEIGHLVVGYNETFQQNTKLGKKTNQEFVNIPFGRFRDKLEYLCQLYGIKYVKQEESYTSKASFFDKDIIPTYNADNPQEYDFSGRRTKRGLYKTKEGKFLNADVNGALNILKKSNVVALTSLYGRGELDTPIRIRVS